MGPKGQGELAVFLYLDLAQESLCPQRIFSRERTVDKEPAAGPSS